MKEATDTSDAGASGEEATETVINLIKPSVRENVAVILRCHLRMSLKPSEIKIKASKTIIDWKNPEEAAKKELLKTKLGNTPKLLNKILKQKLSTWNMKI